MNTLGFKQKREVKLAVLRYTYITTLYCVNNRILYSNFVRGIDFA